MKGGWRGTRYDKEIADWESGIGEGIEEERRHAFACIIVDGNSARGNIASLGSVRDVAECNTAGEAISDLEICHLCCLWRLFSEMRICEV